MTPFNLRISAFSVCWLRAYDFGLEQDALEGAVAYLKTFSLVEQLSHVANSDEIDEVDRGMFDVRYQERSKIVRVRFHPFELVNQDLGVGHQRSGMVFVNLMLDLASGFGVFDLCLPQAQIADAFTIEEIGFLTRQWLLPQDDLGRPQRLNVRPASSDQVAPLYIREVMNFYFLQVHRTLWEAANPEYRYPLQNYKDFRSWFRASHEADPKGCGCLRELNRSGFIRSAFPTSFGPILDIWGVEGIEPGLFDADLFGKQYASEIAWLFTDGQRTTLGESLRNERQTKSLALFIWPNHALYVNQNLKAISADRIRSRVERYGCVDVEIIRILEILNLQSALLHAFDSLLDQQLEQISSLTAQDQYAVIKITEQRINISRSLRSFDYFNLFHTAYWEPLFVRLLENPRLRFHDAESLVEAKSARLDEEIQRAVVIQDRARQQQQREQELDVLRGLHSLSLANDVQSNALKLINFIVSATASFAFAAVLAPLLTSVSGASPSFQEVYPWAWIGVNAGIFLLVVFVLTNVSSALIGRKSQVVELEGRLDLPYDMARLQAYLAQQRNVEYFHLDVTERSGYLRVHKPSGILILEFNHERIYRFILFLQAGKLFNAEQLKWAYVDEEIRILREQQVVL